MIYRLFHFLLLWQLAAGEWTRDSDHFPEGDAGEDDCSLIGGGVDKLVCSTVGTSVEVLYSTWIPQMRTAWTITATLTPPCGGCDYGQQVGLMGDDVTGNLLFVSSVDSTTDDGRVYFYRGSWSQWSAYQILTPTIGPKIDFGDDTRSKFGMQMDVDRYTNRKLYVGCENCNVTNNYNDLPSGAVFVYEATPDAKSMRHVGTLTSSRTAYSHIGKEFLAAYDDLLVTSVSYENTYVDALIYDHEPPIGDYPQRLHGRNGFAIASADAYEDTVVLGAPSATISAVANAGEVYVAYPYTVSGRRLHDENVTEDVSVSETTSSNSTDDSSTTTHPLPPKPKPKPSRVMWSFSQILRAATPTLNMNYGTSVAIEGDTMFVGTSSSQIYVLERSNGMWSQQQVLTALDAENVLTDEGLLVAYSSTTTNFTSYSADEEWNCLIVEVMDQFGDGWDGAMLHIEAPDGSVQRFAPYCGETPSPLSFRYCPPSLDDSVGGIYKLYIKDAPKAKFNWEILWRVYRELGSTGEWFTGNHETRMDFFFDIPEVSFQERKMHELQHNATCSQCPSEGPKPKPKAKARALKSGTTAAPTLSYTQQSSFDILTVETVGTEWFREDYQGTEYYISDVEGRRLFHRGTLCEGSVTQDCWVGLPDGEYVLRVSGNLLGDSGDHSWEFCGRANGAAQEELQFIIRDGACIPLSHISSTAYCSAQDALIVGLGTVVLEGSTAHSLSQLSEYDDLSLGNALSVALPGVVPSSVSIVSLTYDSDEGMTYIQFRASIHKGDLFASIASLEGQDSEEMLHADAGALLSIHNHIDESTFSSKFVYSALHGDSGSFSKVTSAHLNEFMLTGAAAVSVASAPAPSPQSANTNVAVTDEKSTSSYFDFVSMHDVVKVASYVMGAAAVAIVIYAVVSKYNQVRQAAAEVDMSVSDVSIFECAGDSAEYDQVHIDEEVAITQNVKQSTKELRGKSARYKKTGRRL